MSVAAYPEYRESGVEWIGRVPAHWEIHKLKRVCDVFPSNVDKKSYEGEVPVQLCNYTDVYYNEKITADIDFMVATAPAEQVTKFTLRSGDTIITKDSETADDIAIAAFVPVDLPGVVCGYHLSVIRPFPEVNGAFVKRFFDSACAKAYFAVSANGLTRVGLGQYALDNTALPLPSLPEQSAIVTFLDRETGKIDALVAEQERLMGLLKEKRQAVISQAVTKGLNPNVPMKDSGVDWLDTIPAHWTFKRTKDVCAQIVDCKNRTPAACDDGEYFVVRTSCIKNGKFDIEPGYYTNLENFLEWTEKGTPKSGDILFTREAPAGEACLAPTKLSFCLAGC